jgi:hypothetical protein
MSAPKSLVLPLQEGGSPHQRITSTVPTVDVRSVALANLTD